MKSNYLGILVLLVVFGAGLSKRYFFDNEKVEDYCIIFSDASDSISPSFIHQNNKNYYKDQKVVSFFVSLFFVPGIAVADFNHDGFQDFVVVSSTAGSLPQFYLNDRGRGFKLDESLLEKDLIPHDDPFDSNIAPYLFDFDADGNQDLLIVSIKCSKFFWNDGQKFIYEENHPLSKDCTGSISALPHDFNRDGKLDIMLLRYWNDKWQKTLEMSSLDMLGDKNEVSRQIMKIMKIFNGKGSVEEKNGNFNTIYANDLTRIELSEPKARWSFDAMITDLDNDDVDELVVANDFGDDRIYNFNNFQITNVSEKFFYPDRRNGMSVATNYLPGDPYPFLYISNILIKDYQEKGNFYLHYNKKQKLLIDEAEKYSIDNCNWAWSAAIADFNIDGFNDIYVANGYITSERDKKNGNNSNAEGDFKMMTMASLPNEEAIGKKVSPYFDSQTSGIFDVKNFPSSSGNQKDCFKIYSPEQKKFVDAARDKSLDVAWDGRAAAMIDFDNDGDLDLLVTAQNDQLRLLKNNTQDKQKKNNWIGFNITNHQFVRKITVKQGWNKYYKDWNAGRSGFLTTSDPRIYFTMQNDSDIEVEFKFSDGRIVERKFSPGRYYDLGVI